MGVRPEDEPGRLAATATEAMQDPREPQQVDGGARIT